MLVPFRDMHGKRKEVGRETDDDFLKWVGLEIIKGICEQPPVPCSQGPGWTSGWPPPCFWISGNLKAETRRPPDRVQSGTNIPGNKLTAFPKRRCWTFFSFGFILGKKPLGVFRFVECGLWTPEFHCVFIHLWADSSLELGEWAQIHHTVLALSYALDHHGERNCFSSGGCSSS